MRLLARVGLAILVVYCVLLLVSAGLLVLGLRGFFFALGERL